MSARPEPVTYGDRAVFTVSGFNQGVAGWLARLGNVWVEGELSELTPRARMVFFCLKDERRRIGAPGLDGPRPVRADRAARRRPATGCTRTDAASCGASAASSGSGRSRSSSSGSASS